jgi:hypothetical protein
MPTNERVYIQFYKLLSNPRITDIIWLFRFSCIHPANP